MIDYLSKNNNHLVQNIDVACNQITLLARTIELFKDNELPNLLHIDFSENEFTFEELDKFRKYFIKIYKQKKILVQSIKFICIFSYFYIYYRYWYFSR